jgi:hypothetical protein
VDLGVGLVTVLGGVLTVDSGGGKDEAVTRTIWDINSLIK